MMKNKKKFIMLGTVILGVSTASVGTIFSIAYFRQEQKEKQSPKIKILQNAANNMTIMQSVGGPKQSAPTTDPYDNATVETKKQDLVNKFIKKLTNKLTKKSFPILEKDVKSWLEDSTKRPIKLEANQIMNKSFFGTGANVIYPYKAFTLKMPIKFSSAVIKINVILYIPMTNNATTTTGTNEQKNVLLNIQKDLLANKDGIYHLDAIKKTTHELFTTIDQDKKDILKGLKSIPVAQKNTALPATNPLWLKIVKFKHDIDSLKTSLKEDFENKQKNNVQWIKDFLKITYPGQTGIPTSIKSKLNLTINSGQFEQAIKANFVDLQTFTKPSDLITALSASVSSSFKSDAQNEMLTLKLDGSTIGGALSFKYTDIKGVQSGKVDMPIVSTTAIELNIYKNHQTISDRLEAAMKVKMGNANNYKNIQDISHLRNKLYTKVVTRIVASLKDVYDNEYNQETKRPYELKYIIELPSTGSGASLVKHKIEITKGLTQAKIDKIVLAIEAADVLKAGTPPTLPKPIGDFIQEASTKKVYFEFKGDYKIIVDESIVSDYKQKALETRVDLNDNYDVITGGSGLKFEINTKIRTFAEKISEVRKVFKLGLADDAYLGNKGTNSAPTYDDTNLKTALIEEWNKQFTTSLAKNVEITDRRVTDSSVGAIVKMKSVKIKDGNNVLHEFVDVVTSSENGKNLVTYSKKPLIIEWKNSKGQLMHKLLTEHGASNGITKPKPFELGNGRYKIFNIQFNLNSSTNKYNGADPKMSDKNGPFWKETSEPYFNNRHKKGDTWISNPEVWYVLDSLTGEIQMLWYQENVDSKADFVASTTNINQGTLINGLKSQTISFKLAISISHDQNKGPRSKMIIKVKYSH